jgi:alkylation response protein AidB-like acyl-CoA dehydrogenase
MTEVLSLARRFADEVLVPAAMETERTGRIPQAQLDALAAMGFYGLTGPVDDGGLGADHATFYLALEILASGCLSTAFVLLQHFGAVRAIAGYGDERIREQWLRPLCEGKRRAGLALAGAIPGPPMLRARPVTGGYVIDGFSPWVTGWGMIDTLYTAARDEDDNVVWVLLDADLSELSVEPLELAAVMASQTVEAYWQKRFVPFDRLVHQMPLREWQQVDAGALRSNGSLALGLTARCCTLIGPSSLDDELVSARGRLNAATPVTMPAARAAASELAVRATAALIVAKGSSSILTGSDPQRLAREAMFLLVFASRPAIKTDLFDLLVRRG